MPAKRAERRDWFRRTTWTAQDQEEFFARLRRARTSSRGQYLLIQAGAIKECYPDEAFRLLQILLDEYPARTWLALAYLTMANCHVIKNQPEQAVECFRNALQQEKDFPNVRTNAWLDYATYVIESQWTACYPEILDTLLGEPYDRLMFPCQLYAFHGAIAVICDHFARPEEAAQHARLALGFAQQENSGFRYHAIVGLVTSANRKTIQQLKRIARCAE